MFFYWLRYTTCHIDAKECLLVVTRLFVPGAFHLKEAVTEFSQAPAELFSAMICNLGLLERW